MPKYVIERELPGAGTLSADDPDTMFEHARLGGFPADAVHRVGGVIDQTTAEAS